MGKADSSSIELDKSGRYHGKTPREHIEACRLEMRWVKKREALLGEELSFWYEWMNTELRKAFGS